MSAEAYVDAGDRDLEKEPIFAADGRQLTEEDFERLSELADADWPRPR